MSDAGGGGYRFDRTLSLIVGKGSDAVEITDLRVTFDITKDSSKHSNKSAVQVWGLAPPTRKAMERPDTTCSLKAGYAEEGGPVEVFRGDVTFGWSRFEGPDVVTTLELGDGAKQIRDSVVSLGYAKGTGARQALRDVAAKMGLTVRMSADLADRDLPAGFSNYGSARTALDKITRGAGWSWSVQDGVLQVLGPAGTNNRTVVDLAVDSGLIGHPERQRRGSHEAIQVEEAGTKRVKRAASATEKWDGWRVRSLLLPGIIPGDRVKLSSRTVDALLTVRKVRHVGDTHGGDWISELELLDPAEQPKKVAVPAGKATKGRASA